MEFNINLLDNKYDNSDVCVTFMYEEETGFSNVFKDLNSKFEENAIENIFKIEKFNGEFGKIISFATLNKIKSDNLVFIGLGKYEEMSESKYVEIGAKLIKYCEKYKEAKSLEVIFNDKVLEQFDPVNILKFLTEGIIIGNYKFNKYKTQNNNKSCLKEVKISVEKDNDLGKLNDALIIGKKIGNCVNLARDLINEPASQLTPAKLSKIASGIENIETKIYEKEEIEKMGMGAFLAVSFASKNEPKFIHMQYKPVNARKKIALIGKGITFDSGGLDLKPPSSMLNMKDDMSGAASVIAIMSAISGLNIPLEVHGIVAACENMIGNQAYKPGDILKAMNGKTIEVDNTDAEGRLTLADALCFADKLNVDEIIDIATLTGACVVALGSSVSGLMGNDEIIKKIINCSKITGENMWQLPMFNEYNESLKSDIADMKNTGSRFGGAQIAACFLKNFVENKNWVHIDIAGSAYIEKPNNLGIKYATGAVIRTMLTYLQTQND